MPADIAVLNERFFPERLLRKEESSNKYDVDWQRLIGKGGFAKIYPCVDKATGRQWAFKVALVTWTLNAFEHLAPHPHSFRLHALLCCKWHSDAYFSILTCWTHSKKELLDSFQDDTCIYQVMEKIPHGELFDFIIKRKKLNEVEVYTIAMQLLSTLAWLHSYQIVHRDLKPENLLIHSLDPLQFFGTPQQTQWAKQTPGLMPAEVAASSHGSPIEATPCGSMRYAAPEILRGISAAGGRPRISARCGAFTPVRWPEIVKVDIFSAGVVMYAMVTGRFPFHGKEQARLLESINKQAISFKKEEWARLEPGLDELIAKMLHPESAQRPTAQEAVNSTWFRTMRQKIAKQQQPSPQTEPVPTDVEQQEIHSDLAAFKAQFKAMQIEQQRLEKEKDRKAKAASPIPQFNPAPTYSVYVLMATLGLPCIDPIMVQETDKFDFTISWGNQWHWWRTFHGRILMTLLECFIVTI
eukprot:gene11974-2186_t